MNRENIERVCRLSPLQEGLLFHAVRDPESIAYVNQHSVTLEGRIDRQLFQEVWRDITARHQILRTSFHWEGVSWPVQVIHRQAEPELTFVDLRQCPLNERTGRYSELADEQRQRAFALNQAPLFRVVLVRLEDELYALCWTHHHLILDGWSGAIVARELFTIYESRRLGVPPDLPRAGTFSDFLDWVQRQEVANAQEFWSNRLKGFSRLTPLPYFAVNGSANHAHDHVISSLERAETIRVRSLLRSQGFTVSTLVNAAWAMMLMRHSRENSVIYGITMSGRPPELPAIEHTVGLFINTLPMRIQRSPRDTGRTLMQRIQNQIFELQTFEHTPLPQVQKWSGADPMSPLFESLVVVEPYLVVATLAKSGLNTLRIREVQIAQHTTYPLSIVIETEDQLTAKFTYDRHYFRDDHLRRLANEFFELVVGLASSPDRALTEFHRIGSSEQARILRRSRGPVIADARFTPVHRDFSVQARMRSERLAVVCGRDSITYRDLDRWSDAIAVRLRDSGAGPETPVAVMTERSIETIAAILGILKSGRAYIPIDPAAPRRMTEIIQSAGARVLYGAHVPEDSAISVLRVDRDDASAAEQSLPATFPEALAYVIYTSGSTGQPKGVAISHANLFHSNRARMEFYREEVGAFLLLSPLFFDSSVAGLFWTLTTGGTLVLPSASSKLDTLEMAGEIAQKKVTHLLGLPSFYQELLNEPQASLLLTTLRTVVVAGEPCPPALADKHFKVCPTARMVNEYGPTEATVWCTAFEATPAKMSIGSPIAGTSVVLLDVDGQPVPEFATGELHIGGAGVARGYWRRPDLTAERFVPDPFSDTPGARAYRSGDLGRWQEDGTLMFLGRSDHQVKIRGYRVEPGELEAAILTHPGVRACAVVATKILGDPALVAYVIGVTEDEGIERALIEFLRPKLPAYLMPSRVLHVTELPRTATGKVDYQSLSLNAEHLPSTAVPQERPRTLTEQLIAGIWTDVLGIEFIGREQNFFDLGGHSIHALRVIGRIRSRFSLDISLSRLFELPTIAGLAAEIDWTSRDNLRPIEPISRDGNRFPLSFAQERMWLLHKLSPESSAYNIPIAIEIEGMLDIAALERSLTAVAERHEILRSVIEEYDGDPGQRVQLPARATIPLIDLSRMMDSEAEEQERRVGQEEAATPFVLSIAPLFRARLARRSVTRHTLYLTIHHIAADAWSMRVLLREMGEIYAAFASGRQPMLPDLPVQYLDYAAWQRRAFEDGELQPHINYWVEHLENALTSISLPPDRLRQTDQVRPAGVISTRLLPETATKLRAFARKEGLTPFMVMAALFGITLLRWSGQEEVCLGTPSDDRPREELDGLIGLFVNTLVLRISATGSPDFREMLRRVKRLALDAHQHHDAPFDAVVEALRPDRDRESNPLFQVMIVYGEEIATEQVLAGGLRFRTRPTSATDAKFNLILTVSESHTAMEFHWEFNSGLFDRETIERMAAAYEKLLDSCLESPHQRVYEVTLLDQAEQQLLLDWGSGQPAAPCVAKASLPSLIREQALHSPSAPALLLDGDVWTYERLIRDADMVAARLTDLGLSPGDIAGVCMRRGPDTIAVMLGILIAGAAYLPLDPDDPPSRIISLAERAGVRVLIASATLSRDMHSSLIETQLLVADPNDLRTAQVSDAVKERFDPAAGSIAYVMYTSGTSGTPKGVAVSHSAVLRLAFGLGHIIHLSGENRVLHAAPLAFDASVLEIWAVLLCGGCVVIAGGDIPDLQRLGDDIIRSRTDTLWLTSGLFNTIVDTNLTSLENVQQLLIGGEALSVAHVRRYREKYRSTALINGYGPTENTTFTCCHPIPDVIPHDISSIPIGRPIGGTRIYVLDRRLNFVPIGVTGELFAAGEGLALGYLGDAALTAERFVPDPYGERPGIRMYRTGDLARWRSDGTVEFMGRVDRQAKIHGRRIEPGEVEHLLRLHPGVRDAAVKIVKGPSSHLSLLSYYAPAEASGVDSESLRKWLQGCAPRYMIPSMIMPVASLPRTGNGKIDYRNLPDAPELASCRPSSEVRTEIERRLIGIWRDTLRLDTFGIHDNFFTSGGDSLLALRVCARATQEGLSLTLKDMFTHQTIAELATVLETRSAFAASAPSAQVAAPSDDVPGPVPLNASQQFFLEPNPASPDHFNISSFIEVRARFSDSQWRDVIAAVAQNHDSLRLRFTDAGGRWSAEVLDHLEMIPFARVDLRSLKPAEQDRRIQDEARQRQTGLSIREGRMFQIVLFELGLERCDRLLTIVHHLAADGSSVPIMLESLERAIRCATNGQDMRLPKPSCSWRRWSSTLKALAASPEIMRDLNYWTCPERMQFYPLPRDYQGENHERTTAEIISELSVEETANVLGAAHRFDSGIPEAVLSAVVAGASEWAQTPFLNLDWIAHGREPIRPDLDVSMTTGYFSLRVPLAIETRPVTEIAELLTSIRNLIRTLPHGGLSYGILRFMHEDTDVREMLRATPQPELSFNYLGDFDLLHSATRMLTILSAPTGAVRGGNQRRPCLIQVFASMERHTLRLLWRYSSAIHDRTTIERLAEGTTRALQRLAESPSNIETQFGGVTSPK